MTNPCATCVYGPAEGIDCARCVEEFPTGDGIPEGRSPVDLREGEGHAAPRTRSPLLSSRSTGAVVDSLAATRPDDRLIAGSPRGLRLEAHTLPSLVRIQHPQPNRRPHRDRETQSSETSQPVGAATLAKGRAA